MHASLGCKSQVVINETSHAAQINQNASESLVHPRLETAIAPRFKQRTPKHELE